MPMELLFHADGTKDQFARQILFYQTKRRSAEEEFPYDRE